MSANWWPDDQSDFGAVRKPSLPDKLETSLWKECILTRKWSTVPAVGVVGAIVVGLHRGHRVISRAPLRYSLLQGPKDTGTRSGDSELHVGLQKPHSSSLPSFYCPLGATLHSLPSAFWSVWGPPSLVSQWGLTTREASHHLHIYPLSPS